MTSDLGSRMVDALRECFDAEIRTTGDHHQISYGALKLLDVSVGKTGKTLIVHTESDAGSSDEVILDTNRRFRRYLDITTGYSTKERLKKAKKVGEGD